MLSRVPFVGFALFFVSGILLNEYLIPDFVTIQPVFTILLLLTAAAFLYAYARRANRAAGMLLACFLVYAGILAGILQNNQLKSDLAALSGKVPVTAYRAVVRSLPEKRPKTIRFEITIKKILYGGAWKEQNIPALVSIPADAAVIPKAGEFIVVNGTPERPGEALNPAEFDYPLYLRNKGIIWTDYLYDGSYQVVASDRAAGPAQWSVGVSEWADRKFRENIENDASYGLVKAMLLGRRDDLRSDQVDDYTTSGTVHILSVSGMHVAIIFLVISSSLGWLKKKKAGKYIYLIAVTSLLCFYALVTGLPPSVQRATLMCIVFVISEVFARKAVSMNTLAISALIILMADPHALFDVGFQLSYLAMAGIFLLYEPVSLLWQPSNWFTKYIWQISALSFAAQLATFPLSLYYFHQFPFYFWLVNPFVIFFTNILLPAAMVLLAFSLFSIGWLQQFVNLIVDWSAYFTNVSAAVPKRFPGYLIENLYLDRIEVLLLYTILLLLWLAYFKQELILLKCTSVVCFIFVFYALSTSTQTYLTSQAVIHAVPRHSVISFKEGNRLFISCDSAFIDDTDAFKFRIRNYAIAQGITETIYLNSRSDLSSGSLFTRNLPDGRLMLWKGVRIFQGSYKEVPSLDYVLVDAGRSPFGRSGTKNSDATFILGGEIRGRSHDQWKAYLSSQNLRFYDLYKGALLLN
jgi:competence protein ComEC